MKYKAGLATDARGKRSAAWGALAIRELTGSCCARNVSHGNAAEGLGSETKKEFGYADLDPASGGDGRHRQRRDRDRPRRKRESSASRRERSQRGRGAPRGDLRAHQA